MVLTIMCSVVAALALVPWTQARIFLQIPVAWRSSSQVNVSWTHDAGDPIFSLQLARDIFHDTFSIANNVDPTRDFISLLLGVVPEGWVLVILPGCQTLTLPAVTIPSAPST